MRASFEDKIFLVDLSFFDEVVNDSHTVLDILAANLSKQRVECLLVDSDSSSKMEN